MQARGLGRPQGTFQSFRETGQGEGRVTGVVLADHPNSTPSILKQKTRDGFGRRPASSEDLTHIEPPRHTARFGFGVPRGFAPRP